MSINQVNDYLRKGFSCLPCGQDKRPLVAWADFQRRQPTLQEADDWWTERPDANIGLVTGPISNLTIIDCDALEAIEKLEAILPDSLECPIVETPRGGRHYYFKYCQKLHSRNGAQDKIDVKSEGAYVLCPPSKTKKGVYRWHKSLNLESIPERPAVPPEVIEFLSSATSVTFIQPAAGGKSILSEGNRDNYIFHAALQFLKDGLPRDEAESIILDIAKACKPPFPEKEALAKVESAWRHYTRKNPQPPTEPETRKTNLRCFSEIPKVPLEWLWPGRFPLGMLSLIAGQQGQGKSTFTTWMACRLSRGDFWPDGPGLDHPVDTLLITSEDPAEQVIKYRIEAGGGDDSHIFQMDAVLDKGEEFPFDFNKHLPALEKELEKNSNMKFVVVDPLASHMGGELDASDMNRVRWSLAGLARCSKKFNVCVTGVGHFKKNEDVDEVLNKIAGSYQFSSLPRAVWMIMEDKRDQEEPKRKFFLPGKANACQPRGGFSFHIGTVLIDGQETGKIIVDPEKSKYCTADELHARNRDVRLLKTETIEAFIADYLADGPRRSHEDLDEALVAAGYSPRTADRVKTEMKQAGKISFRKEDGIYWIFLTTTPGRFGTR